MWGCFGAIHLLGKTHKLHIQCYKASEKGELKKGFGNCSFECQRIFAAFSSHSLEIDFSDRFCLMALSLVILLNTFSSPPLRSLKKHSRSCSPNVVDKESSSTSPFRTFLVTFLVPGDELLSSTLDSCRPSITSGTYGWVLT